MDDITHAEATWNLTAVDADFARRRIAGGASDPPAIDWRRVRVAHLDTGIRDHPVFGGLHGGASWVRLTDGVNYVEPGQPPIEPPHRRSVLARGGLFDLIADVTKKDVDGHGTRIASVLCGDWRAVGKLTRVGVAPRLPLVPYRVTDTVLLVEQAVLRNLAEAIRHAVAAGCPVINISMGWPFMDDQGVAAAIDHAYDHGVIVAAAAGQIIDKVTFPGKFRRTIGVGGHRPDGRIWADYSEAQYRFIDIWAPASRIVRARPAREEGAWTLDTLGGVGTSYATAHVSAAAALWLRFHGENALQAHYPEPWQRIEAFRALLRTENTPLIPPRDKQGKVAAGRLKIDKLLRGRLPPRDTLVKQAPLAG